MPGPDGLAARVAARQRGLATADQLLAAGMSRSGISRRVAAGRLRPVYRRIYLVGHPVAPPLAIELGAVLACSPDAFLSHFSGANLYALLKLTRPNVDVTVVGRNPGKHARIAVHRVRQIDPRDVTRLGGIPTTTPARILLDLAEVAQLRQLEIAWDEAHSRKLVKAKDITVLIDRSPGRRGIKRLRALQERDSGPTPTRSEAEELLLDLIRRARLPAPEMNVLIGSYRMDFVWRENRLILELDGGHHLRPRRRDYDNRRDAELADGGWRVDHVTYHELVNEPEALVARVARALV